ALRGRVSLIADGTRASQPRHSERRALWARLLVPLGKVARIRSRPARNMHPLVVTAQPRGDVRGIPDLAHLAIVDDVDAGLYLLLHAGSHGFGHAALEGLRIG